MSCTEIDWKAYALGELDRAEGRTAEVHAATCAACREELASLRLTLDALATLKDEEMPRRIAFVSDKVFEPKWWQKIWSPSFAAASVLAAAILVHAFVGGHAADDAVIQAEVKQAVTKAVAEVEAKHQEQLEVVMDAYRDQSKLLQQVYFKSVGLVRQ